jgi:hypothetical protein
MFDYAPSSPAVNVDDWPPPGQNSCALFQRLTRRQFESLFRSIGAVIMTIVHGVASVIMVIVNGIVTVFSIIIGFLTCQRMGGRRRRHHGGGATV